MKILGYIGVAFVTIQLACASAAWSENRPNLILFVADDQSVFDYGSYGNIAVPTPATDRFAKESLVFDCAFTGQAICAPSRSMLYTGLYPVRNGCFINHTEIRSGVKTLPVYLKALGYDVILAGKSHVNPMDQFPWTEWFRPQEQEGMPRPGLPFRQMDSFFEQVDGPFCMVVASEYPHGPFFDKSSHDPERVKLEPFRAQTTQERRVNARYYANIEEGEGEFAKVLALLEEHGFADDTVVVYTADHGMFRGKFTVYNSGLRVPLMVRWPDRIAPGRSSTLVSLADILPTFVALAKGTVPRDLDGRNILSVWEGRSQEGHDFVYGVGESQGIQDRSLFPQRSISDGRYNYIYNFNSLERLKRDQKSGVEIDYFRSRDARRFAHRAEEELYDLASDPYELTNIAGRKEVALVQSQLRRELFRWMEQQGDYLTPRGALPYFKPKMHPMDQPNPRFKYHVPDELIGSLEEDYVDAHALTQ